MFRSALRRLDAPDVAGNARAPLGSPRRGCRRRQRALRRAYFGIRGQPGADSVYGKGDLEAMSGAGRPTRFRNRGTLGDTM
jgi:hypothetical protein